MPAPPATDTSAGGTNLAGGDNSVDAWTTGSSTTGLAGTASGGGGGRSFGDNTSGVLTLGGGMVVLMGGVAFVVRRRGQCLQCPKETSRPQRTARTDAETLQLLFTSPQRDAVVPIDDGTDDGTVAGVGTGGASSSGKLGSPLSASRMAKVHPVVPEVWI